MATLRITATPAGSQDAADLSELAGALRESLVGDQRLTRAAALALPGGTSDTPEGPDRIFRLELADGDTAPAALRALGGWLMTHPTAQVAVKVDGPSGGVSLRLAGWSAVAFAAAAERIQAQLVANPTE